MFFARTKLLHSFFPLKRIKKLLVEEAFGQNYKALGQMKKLALLKHFHFTAFHLLFCTQNLLIQGINVE